MILGRTYDKCRALLWGNIGEYHFDCPLDNMLFGFKGVKGDDFKAEVEKGASDEEMAQWLDTHGEKKTPEEVKAWSDEMMAANPYENPEKRDWFVEQVKPYTTRSREDDPLRVARRGRQGELQASGLANPLHVDRDSGSADGRIRRALSRRVVRPFHGKCARMTQREAALPTIARAHGILFKSAMAYLWASL